MNTEQTSKNIFMYNLRFYFWRVLLVITNPLLYDYSNLSPLYTLIPAFISGKLTWPQKILEVSSDAPLIQFFRGRGGGGVMMPCAHMRSHTYLRKDGISWKAMIKTYELINTYELIAAFLKFFCVRLNTYPKWTSQFLVSILISNFPFVNELF